MTDYETFAEKYSQSLLYYCKVIDCKAVLKGWAEAGQHENRHHDGIKTCFTKKESEPSSELHYTDIAYSPMLAQKWCTTNDTNGNPRRCWVIWSSKGMLLDVLDCGYKSTPEWIKELIDLGEVSVPPAEYRNILKQAAGRETAGYR